MSHRFKRSKRLGENKQNTKSKNGGLLKRLPMGPGLAKDAVHDFLYVDRNRVSALYAQLFPQGTLTGVKTISQHGFSDDQHIGGDIKIFKAETKSSDTGSEGIEHLFDASWTVPLEVLIGLNDRSLINPNLRNPRLGIIVLLDAYLRIIDYATMKELWEPAITMFQGEIPIGRNELIALMKSIPHTMHAHFLTNDGLLWASLNPGNLTVPTADIVLKHGGLVSGSWKVVFVLDAFPDVALADQQPWSAGQATEAVLTAIQAFRTQIGRPPGWFGITPLMIYREIPPYTGQQSLNLEPSGTSKRME